MDPARYGGAQWAVPLWSERGLIGVLLLGEKRDGGLYTQEEIEIARASGERLIDTQASAEMARRLMALQRQRLAESQVLDRRARRVLHDDVLPRLHAAMLKLSARTAGQAAHAPTRGWRCWPTFTARSPTCCTSCRPRRRRTWRAWAWWRAAASWWTTSCASAFDGVTWEVAPEAAQAARAHRPLSAEVLYYAARETIRNAARYGRAGDARARSTCGRRGLARRLET